MSDAKNPMAEAFLVLNISTIDEWPERHGSHKAIPATKQPTVLHTTRTSAEGEALRLSRTTSGHFVVFEAVAMAMRVDVPTHVGLSGRVFMSQSEARIARLDADDIPF